MTCCLLVVLSVSPVLAGEKPPFNFPHWEERRVVGLAHLKAGDFLASYEALLTAIRMHPDSAAVRGELETARAARFAELMREARASLEERLTRSATADYLAASRMFRPYSEPPALLRALGKLRYRRFGALWVHDDEWRQMRKAVERRAEHRVRELGIEPGLSVTVGADFRLYSDLSDLDSTRLRLRRLIPSLIVEFRETFAPLECAATWGGLDVIVYKHREDYVVATESTNTLGVFDAARRASYFTVTRGFPSTAAIVLHEVTHQLQHKVLALEHAPLWLREGLAVYFEGVRLDEDSRVVGSGNLPAVVLKRLARERPPGSDRWLGVERLVSVEVAGQLSTAAARHDFYAQAGAVVWTLLRDPRLRPMFLAYVAELRGTAGGDAGEASNLAARVLFQRRAVGERSLAAIEARIRARLAALRFRSERGERRRRYRNIVEAFRRRAGRP